MLLLNNLYTLHVAIVQSCTSIYVFQSRAWQYSSSSSKLSPASQPHASARMHAVQSVLQNMFHKSQFSLMIIQSILMQQLPLKFVVIILCVQQQLQSHTSASCKDNPLGTMMPKLSCKHSIPYYKQVSPYINIRSSHEAQGFQQLQLFPYTDLRYNMPPNEHN